MKNGFKLLFTIMIIVLSFTFVSAKTYKCETVDGAYYGKDGKEVDKVQYEKECISHSCEIVGDIYYGQDGKEVDKATFESDCDTTVVTDLPDTNSSNEVLYIIIGGCLILGTTILSISYRRVSDRA